VQDNIIGNCLCVLGDSMAMPVGAMVRKFRDEFEQLLYTQDTEVDRIGAVVGAPEQIGAMP
jgi:NADH-quinone oxidoreductase subunit F